MKTLSFIITVAALFFARPGTAQVLTTGEPATATKTKYVLPSDPKSMTVADEGASSGYIIGKRVDPDKKKNQAKSPTNATRKEAVRKKRSTSQQKRRATQDSLR